MVWTIHRAQNKIFVIHFHRWKHIIAILLPMPACLIKVHTAYNGRVDVVVSESFLKINDITLNNAANCRSLRQPHRQALTNFLRNGENAEFLAELPVITLLSLLKYLQICIERTLFSQCGSLKALPLFVVAISPPIGAGNAQEFESLDFTCRRYMNPAAQIIKLTLLIDGHLLVFWNVIKQFQL